MRIERAEIVAYVLILVGLLLLICTFVMAYFMLTSVGSIATPQDLSKALGEIFGPIVETVIKIMFLGIMGWVGSIATIRGIQLYKEAKPHPPLKPQPQQIQQPKAEEKKTEKA
ncbi:MAG: hypothetical protein QXX79_01515 [Candidatus Bathyarchaeia archaeon]